MSRNPRTLGQARVPYAFAKRSVGLKRITSSSFPKMSHFRLLSRAKAHQFGNKKAFASV